MVFLWFSDVVNAENFFNLVFNCLTVLFIAKMCNFVTNVSPGMGLTQVRLNT